MHGDYSRSTFDPKKHYTGVRMQQGRVQLDSDWNEQVDIQRHFLRTVFNDVLGPVAAPATSSAFEIRVPGSGEDEQDSHGSESASLDTVDEQTQRAIQAKLVEAEETARSDWSTEKPAAEVEPRKVEAPVPSTPWTSLSWRERVLPRRKLRRTFGFWIAVYVILWHPIFYLYELMATGSDERAVRALVDGFLLFLPATAGLALTLVSGTGRWLFAAFLWSGLFLFVEDPDWVEPLQLIPAVIALVVIAAAVRRHWRHGPRRPDPQPVTGEFAAWPGWARMAGRVFTHRTFWILVYVFWHLTCVRTGSREGFFYVPLFVLPALALASPRTGRWLFCLFLVWWAWQRETSSEGSLWVVDVFPMALLTVWAFLAARRAHGYAGLGGNEGAPVAAVPSVATEPAEVSVAEKQGEPLRDSEPSSPAVPPEPEVESAPVPTPSPPAKPGPTSPTGPPSFVIGAGRYYVDGVLCENESEIAYEAQPHGPVGSNGHASSDASRWLVYLDGWERHITTVEEPAIREPALGALDTTTRTQTVWQVKRIPLAPEEASSGASAEPDAWAPVAPEWDEILGRARDRTTMEAGMRADVDGASVPANAVPDSGVSSVENHLFRVEVHSVATEEAGSGTPEEAATIKWSRDNGSVTFPIRGFEEARGDGPVTLHVSGLERDRSQLREGDWIELVDDDTTLGGESGPLARVASVDAAGGVVQAVFADSLAVDVAKRPFLRRWDGEEGAMVVRRGEWLPLENGIQVRFGDQGHLCAGDYWVFSSREEIGGIEWPVGETRAPDGVRHALAPLAVLGWAGDGWRVERDCRRPFQSLTKVAARWADETAQLRDHLGQALAEQRALVTGSVQQVTNILRIVQQKAGTECYQSRQDLEPGDVVSLDAASPGYVERSNHQNAGLVVGVVAERVDDGEEGAVFRLVTRGRIKARVVGRVRVGQLLVPSANAGQARRAPWFFRSGRIVGKALQEFNPETREHTGVIEMVVALG